MPLSGGVYLQEAYEIIDMMHHAEVIIIKDWPLLDCKEYVVDLEMSVAKAAAALELAGADQLREYR